MVQKCTKIGQNRYKMVQNDPKLPKIDPKGSKIVQNRFKSVQNRPRSFKIGTKCSKIGQNRFKIDQNGSKWSKMLQNWSKFGQNWSKKSQMGQNRYKSVQNGPKQILGSFEILLSLLGAFPLYCLQPTKKVFFSLKTEIGTENGVNLGQPPRDPAGMP